MRLFIAEDEAPARARLVESIARVAPQAQVAGTASSVREAAAWLAAHAPPDLLLLDIQLQLSDGLSLELFRGGTLACPTIFTTAYDRFVLQAFEARAVDYLLKPIDEARLAQAFAKHAQLKQHFAGDLQALLAALQPPRFRRRLVGRQGAQNVALPVDDVAYLVSADKLSFAVARDGTRILLDAPLADIERELDPARFFRANRQYLVSAAAIHRFATNGKGRLVLDLRPRADGEVGVSQERAAAFRAWLAQ
jgi:DNA-binding LytR/AlgR family response regulator